MKIKEVPNQNNKTVHELNQGDVFQSDGDTYIKTDESKTIEQDLHITCVNQKCGTNEYFLPETLVLHFPHAELNLFTMAVN